jgi:hypothetical protein
MQREISLITGEETIIDAPVDAAPITREQQESARRMAYTVEADPLFFMSQRGEATTAEWEVKVAEIKARFPYPTISA